MWPQPTTRILKGRDMMGIPSGKGFEAPGGMVGRWPKNKPLAAAEGQPRASPARRTAVVTSARSFGSAARATPRIFSTVATSR